MILNDLVLYDIEEHAWINGEIHYQKGETERIGYRAKHTMTTVFYNESGEFDESTPR